ETQVAGLDAVQCLRQHVKAAGDDALVGQLVLFHRIGNGGGAAGIDRKHAFDILVADIISLDARELFVNGLPSSHFMQLDVHVRCLDGRLGAVQTRLDVELTRGGDKADDLTGFYFRDYYLAQRLAGVEQALADIGQVIVGRRVLDVIRHHRNAGVQRALDRLVEGDLIDHGHGNTVDFA